MKFAFFALSAILLVSCGSPLKPDGSFGQESFVGKFRGNSVYVVNTPEGTNLFIAVNDFNNEIETTNWQTTSGKKTVNHAVLGFSGEGQISPMKDASQILREKAVRLLEESKIEYNNLLKTAQDLEDLAKKAKE
jgi:hypothetical protein